MTAIKRPLLLGLAVLGIAGVIMLFILQATDVEVSTAIDRRPNGSRDATRMAHHRAELEVIAGRPGAAEQLRAAWESTPDRAERLRILDTVGRIPDSSGTKLLVEIASGTDSLAPQAGAAIGRIVSPRLGDELARLARSDASILVRANAARALAKSGGKQHAPALVALVTDPAAPLRVRQESALALARIGDDPTATSLGRLLDALANETGHNSEQLRLSIVQALGGIGSTSAREVLDRHHARLLGATERAFVERALAMLKPVRKPTG